MQEVLILLAAVIPVVLVALYIYKKDRDKESKRLLLKLFFLGILSCVPVVILSMLLDYFLGTKIPSNLLLLFLYVFVKIALIEEGCKWFMVYVGAYNDREFDHIYDAIVYAVFVSLGFAFLENMFYAFDGGITVSLVRAITTVPCHAILAIMMGNYLGFAKQNEILGNKSEVTKNKILSFVIPTIAHTIYDFCIYTEKMVFLIIFLVFVIAIYVYGFIKVRKISKVEHNMDYDGSKEREEKAFEEHIDAYYDTHCPVCGNTIEKSDTKCERCGADLGR